MPPSRTDFPAPEPTGLTVRPFRALTYRRRNPGHLARVSSPAYDLVTAEDRARLAATDPHNIVRLILPQDGSGSGTFGADALRRSAEQAAETLRLWLDRQVLERDAAPALWVYDLQPSDGTPATVGWLAAVALPAPGSRAVLPHEDTSPAAVDGRRALLAATGTDLEPIVLAHDPAPALPALTAAGRPGDPALEVTDAEGVRHRLWRVADPVLIHRVSRALGRTGAVIADGHHRFAAARAHFGAGSGEPDEGAVLALLTPLGPGGLRVRAIHRIVPELAFDEALSRAERGFRSTEVEPGRDGAGLDDAVRRWQADPGGSGLLLSDGRRLVRLDRPSADVRAAVPATAPAAWRNLDVVLAHHGLFKHLWGRRDDSTDVLVVHSVEEALRGAVDRHGVAVLLPPPSPADVAAVARAGARMPRKSTLFVPKPRTGLVLRPHRP